MHIMIKASTEATREAKTLTIETANLKTKTNLTITGDEQSEFFEAVTSDIKTLKIAGKPLTSFILTVEGAQAIGRLVNRCRPSFAKLGLQLGELDWDAAAGVCEIKGALLGSDLPVLSEALLRLTRRACASLSYTQHPLTLYDVKQATGVIVDMKHGDENAQSISDWFDSRELVELEVAKEKAKADRAAAKAKDRKDRHKKDLVKTLKSKAKSKAKGSGTAKNPQPKSKRGGASLTDLA